MAPTQVKKSITKAKTSTRKAAPKIVAKSPVKATARLAGKKTAVAAKPVSTHAVREGVTAPAFNMPATMIGSVSSAKLKGKPYVLYFYPKDDTSGCTAQACGFRDALPAFKKLGIPIIGVSKDNLQSHEKFAKKYQLTFPLASDEDGSTCTAYGTWVEKSMYGRKYMGIERSTFLIDGNGKIAAVWRKVSVPGHVEDVQQALNDL